MKKFIFVLVTAIIVMIGGIIYMGMMDVKIEQRLIQKEITLPVVNESTSSDATPEANSRPAQLSSPLSSDGGQ